jgi:hypothetical protein
VKTLVPYNGGELHEIWDFVDLHHRLYKTFKAATEACEKHQQLWQQVCEATGIRTLKEIFGKLPIGLPLWVRSKVSRQVYAVLTDNQPTKHRDELWTDQDDSTETSTASALTTGPVPSTTTPASPAEVRAKSKVSSGPIHASPVPNAEAPAKEPKKRAAKCTEKSSKRTGKRKATTTGSSAKGAKRSRNSRKTKSAP